MTATYRSDISNKDVVLGHWDPKDKTDWRWYRHTDAYAKLFSAWNAHGGRTLTLKALGFQSGVSDKNACIYLGLKEGSSLTRAQKDRAQAAYNRDLFDWWWTTQGLDVSYKDASGKKVVLKSGVIITPNAVLTSNDVVLVDRPIAVLGLTLMMKDSSGKITKTEFDRLYRGTTKYQNPDRWWRETSWFKGLMNGSAKFEKIGGKNWNKSWGQTFLELSKTNLSKLPQGFQNYVKRVAKAISDKNNTELTACLETWLKQLPSVFGGVPKGKGYLVSDFLTAPLNLNSDMIDYQ